MTAKNNMVEPGVLRFAARCRLPGLACAVLLLAPAGLFAQSAGLLGAYQRFAAAKDQHNAAEALKCGDIAVKLTEESGDRQALAELLRDLGEYSAQAGLDQDASRYYERALVLQESALGADHPDLVPLLTALADLHFKAKRYAEAARFEQRILGIERLAYGEHHENVLATLGKLKDIYLAANDSEGVARIDAQVKKLSAPSDTRGLPGLGNLSRLSGATRRYKQNQGFATVRVFYGTNRAPSGDAKPALYLRQGPRRSAVWLPQRHHSANPQGSGARDSAALGRVHPGRRPGIDAPQLRALGQGRAAGEG